MAQTGTGNSLGVSVSKPTLEGLTIGGTAAVPAIIDLGAASTDKVGFFGVTPIIRRAASGTPSNQIALTTALSSVTVTGAYGFALTSGFSAMLAQLEEIRAALVAYGILTGP